jgi:hypothetical protein
MKFVKDFSYLPMSVVRDQQTCSRLLAPMISDFGSYLRVSTLLLQEKEGAQLWVTKEVSDDLQAADLAPDDIKFAELEWPASRMEVYFEDPEIPTFLVAHVCDAEQSVALGRLTGMQVNITKSYHSDAIDIQEFYIVLMTEDTDTSLISFTYKPEDVDRFATGDLDSTSLSPSSAAPSLTSMDLDEEENEQMRQLAILLFKVLLLASSEGHSVRRTRDKPTKKQGGKPGFKNRPATDRVIVEYLPRHFVERRKAAEAEGKTHKFNGRRGHWRRFHSDKFVNMKGKKKFIYPIPGPDGTLPRKKFVVRKVSGSYVSLP